MKILISADMEGATGVTWPADVLPGTPQWERCRSMFTSDVNAAVLGFFDGGADEVLVNEAHWTMRNPAPGAARRPRGDAHRTPQGALHGGGRPAR
ncbi:M55 family metallopeptidase [Streptomyces sp. KL116D]|uniref:M55 family metallopeptidase n=1 Tax=Streptomyces sp. KL116D TaxID=3045152 RepID=UPI003558B13A